MAATSSTTRYSSGRTPRRWPATCEANTRLVPPNRTAQKSSSLPYPWIDTTVSDRPRKAASRLDPFGSKRVDDR